MMGVEARFQAMPENCELFITARQDRAMAEYIMSFNLYMVRTTKQWPNSPNWLNFYGKAKKVVSEFPGVEDRYFYAGARQFDAIVYLLSPARRAVPRQEDTSLIHQAYYGQELLHPEAKAGQGRPIGLVPSAGVALIAQYLNQISRETLFEHYDDERMYYEAGVYKIHPRDKSGWQVEAIRDEFVGMRDIYQAAAEHGEAVIVEID
jgi:hypothetical protein